MQKQIKTIKGISIIEKIDQQYIIGSTRHTLEALCNTDDDCISPGGCIDGACF
ncbi:hypothetical protein [Aquimarina rhabdastrellae]